MQPRRFALLRVFLLCFHPFMYDLGKRRPAFNSTDSLASVLRNGFIRWFTASVVLAMGGLLIISSGQAVAEPALAGYRDFSYGTTGSPTPTGEKPESKLWWHDGWWWGSLYNNSTQAYHIHYLDAPTQTWVDTGTQLDDRNGSRADTLVDGQRLYVVSHIFTTNAAPHSSPSEWGRLYRYTYNPVSRTYTRDPGFPITVTRGRSETLTIAKDFDGRLWVTYVESKKVLVNCSLSSDQVWGTPFVLPVSSTAVNVSSDDISTIIAFQGDRIGVMWSNQVTRKMYFAVHRDGDPLNSWLAEETASPSPGGLTGEVADDHLNTIYTDSSGRVYAAVKTNLTGQNDPLVMLLIRDQTGGWSGHVFGRKRDQHTRPIVALDEEHGRIYVFATSPESGGTIYYKSSDLSNVSFPTGVGTPLIKSSLDLRINNATSSKQTVSSTTALVVLASDQQTRRYLHGYLPLSSGGPSPPSTPDGLTATTVSSSSIELRWRDNADNEANCRIERALDGTNFSEIAAVGSDITSYVDSGLAPATRYYYRVRAENIGGVSAYSNTASAVTLAGGSVVTLNPVADSYVRDGIFASSNFGTSTSLVVKTSTAPGFNRDTYLKFNLTGLGTIASARLRVYGALSSSGTQPLTAYGVEDSSWTEPGITWNNRPALGSAHASISILGTTYAWYELDMTAFLQSELAAGRTIVTIALHTSSTASPAILLRSREDKVNSPRLVVEPASGP